MSLLPYLIDDLSALHLKPCRTLNQHLGLGVDAEELLPPLAFAPTSVVRHPTGYIRPWRTALSESDTGSTVTVDKNRYQINLDVQQFEPEEISVKVIGGNVIVIEGKHEEKEDDHGFISRHFVRKYIVPDGHDIDEVVSTLSSDGVLTVTAPKSVQKDERPITITQTGVPLKIVDKKTEDKQQ